MSVDLDIHILKMYTCRPTMNFPGQDFQKLANYREADTLD